MWPFTRGLALPISTTDRRAGREAIARSALQARISMRYTDCLQGGGCPIGTMATVYHIAVSYE